MDRYLAKPSDGEFHIVPDALSAQAGCASGVARALFLVKCNIPAIQRAPFR
jgi:hypothetical protein